MNSPAIPSASFHHIAMSLKAAIPSPFVLQVGAMDGVRFDLLYPHLIKGGWCGLLVEPVPDMFALLKNTYATQPQLRFADCAIADYDGTLTLKRADPAAVVSGILPAEALGMSTACGNSNLAGDPVFVERFAANSFEISVPCRRLQGLLDENTVTAIDLVMIDVEGADLLVAKQIDLNRYHPSIVCFEYAHLKMEDMRECCAHFLAHGYALALCAEDEQNILFYKK
jgi:FkbM family methyltransferase